MNEPPPNDATLHSDRQPRWEFRKQRKLQARRERRQRDASARDEINRAKEDKDLEAHSLYVQQKRQWEDREKRYNMINLARKRAAEAERAAKEAAKKEWQEALLRIPIMPPSRRENNNQRGPKFVVSSASQQDPDAYKTPGWP